MANNRLFITCSKCSARRMLYKYYPAAGYIGDGIGEWLNQHALECDEPAFPTCWENDDDFDGRYPDGRQAYPFQNPASSTPSGTDSLSERAKLAKKAINGED